MKKRDSQLCLSVSDFFTTVNWQGVQLTPVTLEITDEKSWRLVSLKEFFGLFNWQGQRLASRQQNRPEPSFYLTTQVNKFFQAIAWDGHPEVGLLPKVSTSGATTLVAAEEMKLTNLSELF